MKSNENRNEEAGSFLCNLSKFLTSFWLVRIRVVRAEGDPVKMRILFKNLIENSFKYSDGNHVSVEVNKSKVVVKDRGQGISVEDQEFIFDPFFRADKVRTSKTVGLGLGLNLCYEIVKAHEGEIKVESVLGEGTSFIIDFSKPL